jgi:L-amino acid N-acyltransferase YncA
MKRRMNEPSVNERGLDARGLGNFVIRAANPADAAAMLDIYTPYVTDTSISFETEPPTLIEFAARIEKYGVGWAWLVGEIDGELAGYAYGSPHRERHAYRYSTETSVYVHQAFQGRGVSRKLYRALFDALAAKGYCTALAGVALPNEASVAAHKAAGFTEVGVYQRVGYKFGAWLDVLWLQRKLRDAPLDGATGFPPTRE